MRGAVTLRSLARIILMLASVVNIDAGIVTVVKSARGDLLAIHHQPPAIRSSVKTNVFGPETAVLYLETEHAH